MKNLRNILLAGSLILASASCEKDPKVLTDEDFAKAEWIKVKYDKGTRIWSGYVAERDSTWSDQNWEIYQNKVARKNNFDYIIEGNTTKIKEYGIDSIYLPDLNKDGYVQPEKGVYVESKKTSYSIDYLSDRDKETPK